MDKIEQDSSFMFTANFQSDIFVNDMRSHNENKRRLFDSFCPVSVIIPCFKGEGTIKRAIDSIFVQTMKPSEVIIINDSSGPATSAYLSKISIQFNKLHEGWIKVIELKQQMGPAGARNQGWHQASNRYLAFLDADDAWHPRKIEIQYSWMHNNPNAAITGHNSIWLKHGVSPPKIGNRFVFKKNNSFRLLLSNRFHTRSVMLKRSIPYRFDEAKRYSEDYLLWLEILLNGFKGFYIDLPLAYTFKPQYGASGLSGNLSAMEKGEIDTFCRLYKKKLISFLQLTSLIPFSFLKFVKRKILSILIYDFNNNC